jgi:phage recombination protein Bet
MALPSALDDLPEIFRLTEIEQFELLENFYPGAAAATKKLIIAYCRGMRIDPVLKPVHAVPMKVKTGKRVKRSGGGEYDETAMKDVIMPGIGLYRIQAARTGTYAGKDRPVFGPMVEFHFKRTEWVDGDGERAQRTKKLVEDSIVYPEWCEVTVYKLVGNLRCAYTATEYWMENVAITQDAPNSMWTKRPNGQLAKCAEAQALRMAYPEVGSMPTYEEMMGRRFLDPEDTDHGNGGDELPARQEPQRKSAQVENKPIEGVSTRIPEERETVPSQPASAPSQAAPPPADESPASPAGIASPGQINHIINAFGDRLDEACEKAGLTVRAATIAQLTTDGFTVLRDIKKEWRL